MRFAENRRQSVFNFLRYKRRSGIRRRTFDLNFPVGKKGKENNAENAVIKPFAKPGRMPKMQLTRFLSESLEKSA